MTRTRYTADMMGLRESNLHRDLKSYYAYCHRGVIEEELCGYKIDVLSGREIYEIQTKGFYKIREKIEDLLDEGYSVCVVYPVQGILEYEDSAGRRRKRRKKHSPLKPFDELVYIPNLLKRDGMQVEIVDLHERRTRKSKRNRVRKTRLVGVLGRRTISSPSDMLSLLPPDIPSRFTTRDIREVAKVGKRLAGKVAYTLYHAGVASKIGHKNRYNLYELDSR